MLLFSGSRRRMLASQGHNPCIIGLDITAMIGFSPLGVVALWCSWALWLVLQTTLVFAGPGVRYHRVLGLARSLGGLDIQGFDKLGRPEQAGLDILLTISILEVLGLSVRGTYWHASAFEVTGRRRRYHDLIE